MKILAAIWFFLWTFICSHGQERSKQDIFKPFAVIIIKPDKAQIPDSLNIYADAMEDEQFMMHFSVINSLQNQWKLVDDETKKKIEQQVHQTIKRAREDLNFRYFHTIAIKTKRELNSLFNSNEFETDFTFNNPVLTCELVDRSHLLNTNLKKIGQRYKVDYIISFENIRTAGTKKAPTLRYVVKLFSTSTNKEILRKEIEGNASVENYKSLEQILPPGNIHERGVNCSNYLECMMISAVRFSTEELYKTIEKRQKK
ncbi:MAG: hypothetical protein ACK5RG_18310 [Cyclobacteriaceae bacterium]|jgi:hypothetical protein|nr:hypothetical protein [Flammeovirgaceae bacterium]